eukprot:m.167806 g.167806  ORF g.167806 m.167806 type:complete len:325 (+) comp12880_c0_seq1:2257-3231(+)
MSATKEDTNEATRASSDAHGASSRHAAIAGAVSGGVTRALLQPLDVLKIRMQLTVSETHQPNPSLMRVTSNLVRHEGLRALWKGHVPAQILSVTYGAVGFATYAQLCDMAGVDPHEAKKKTGTIFSQNFVLGGVSGIVATLTCHPLDTVRTRVVGDTSRIGMVQMVKRILFHEGPGPTAFYRGVTPSVLLIFPYSGLQFGYYHAFRAVIERAHWLGPLQPVCSLLSGAAAGLVAKWNVLPLDMIKKRLQMQGTDPTLPHYRGVVHCARTVWKNEGVFAFFRGAGPATLKAALTTASIFAVYERVLDLLESRTSDTGHNSPTTPT